MTSLLSLPMPLLLQLARRRPLMSLIGGWPKNLLYSRLNWLALS